MQQILKREIPNWVLYFRRKQTENSHIPIWQ